MDEIEPNDVGRRSYIARIGITALNLLLPGLGLLRVGKWRAGILWLFAPFVVLALFAYGMGHFPVTSYARAVFALVLIVALSLALYLVPSISTWHASKLREPMNQWSRWYSLVAIAVISNIFLQFSVPILHRFYKPYYAPSQSMSPTVMKNDRFIVDMRWRGPFRRGEIVVFRGPIDTRVSRIAALPGDRIAVRAGVPVLNGVATIQRPAGRASFAGDNGVQLAKALNEQLPGEKSSHRILETGRSTFDDMREVAVPPNHFFLLGDNRDISADSRVPLNEGGMGMVSEDAVIGRPMYVFWSNDHLRIGTRLDK